MLRWSTKGLSQITIIVIVLIVAGILTVIATSSRRTVTVDSREDVELIFAKKCPNEEEIAAAERYIQEAGLDPLSDKLQTKKEEKCSIIQRLIPSVVVSECVSPYLVPVDPLLQSCRICYDKISTKTQQVVKERKCENYVIQSTDECFNWDITSYKPEINCYNSIWKGVEPTPFSTAAPTPG